MSLFQSPADEATMSQDSPPSLTQDPPSPASYPNHSTTWTPIESMTPISTNPSRKRSRDETAFDTDGSYFPSVQVNTPAPIPEEEPIYGEGMTLLNPREGIAISAESQTGTWYEEKAEEEAKNPPPVVPVLRPVAPSSRKSIRLSQSSKAPFVEYHSAPASPPKNATSHPEIDEATVALGIGWTRIASEDEHTQAAARGWVRYLENHYPRHVHGAEILLKSTGLSAYLVGCQEGFYLFDENLLEGRLVGRSWDVCLHNLKATPSIAFEGEEILRAERTPGPDLMTAATAGDEAPVQPIGNWPHDFQAMNGFHVTNDMLNGISNGHPGPAIDNESMEID